MSPPHAPARQRRLRRRARPLIGLLVVVVVALGPAASASAHAALESSNPGDGSVVPTAPRTVSLQFSESVQVQGDSIRVISSAGKRVDKSQASANGSVVTVPLGSLAEGSYLVSWRVISADSHPVQGAFTFSVGHATTLSSSLADHAFADGSDRGYQIADGAFRAMAYVGALLAAGVVAMGAALRRAGEPTPVSRLAGIAAGVGLVGVLAQIPIQATLATGDGLKAIAESGVVKLALTDGVGWSTLVTTLGLVAIIVAVGLPFRSAPRALALAGAVLAPLGFAITGHTRTMSPAVVGYLADVAHLVAAAAWLGGLVAVLGVVRRRRAAGDDDGAAEAVGRFSGWAALVLAGVVVAGSVMGYLEVRSIHALVSTTYGVVLLVKVAVVAAVVAAAAWNRFRLVPRLRSDEGAASAAWPALVRTVRFEAIGIVAALLLTAALVNITPARTAVDNGPVTADAPLGSGKVHVIVDPARVGRNDIHVYLEDRLGRPVGRYKTAALELSLPAQQLGPLDRTPVLSGKGHFVLTGTPLSPGGRWSLTITVKPDRFTEQQATVSFDVR